MSVILEGEDRTTTTLMRVQSLIMLWSNTINTKKEKREKAITKCSIE